MVTKKSTLTHRQTLSGTALKQGWTVKQLKPEIADYLLNGRRVSVQFDPRGRVISASHWKNKTRLTDLGQGDSDKMGMINFWLCDTPN